MKNITLSAEEDLIRKARQKATREHSSLNKQFRAWLARYTGAGSKETGYDALMDSLGHIDSGGKYSRDEMNER